jgi:hypothetical protein
MRRLTLDQRAGDAIRQRVDFQTRHALLAPRVSAAHALFADGRLAP